VIQGSGGTGGGAAGLGSAATVNTGGGGGGGYATTGTAGGSGVVILRYPAAYTISNPGGGLTFSTVTDGSDKVTTVTAGTGNIEFA
jgi:hypothetical protein